MLVETVPIDSISPDPANLRKHPERNLDAIKASLRRFKQQKPVVVDEAGVIRAGNGTYAAARELGWTEIDIVRTTLRDSEATAYAIADNRTAILAEWDDEALADTLKALESEGFDLDAVGFNQHELDKLLGNGLAAGGVPVDDPAGEWQGMPEFQNEDKTAFQSLHVHFKDQAAVDAFARLIAQKVTANTRSLWYPEIEIESYADKAYAAEGEDES